jgi:hypothetical protein
VQPQLSERNELMGLFSRKEKKVEPKLVRRPSLGKRVIFVDAGGEHAADVTKVVTDSVVNLAVLRDGASSIEPKANITRDGPERWRFRKQDAEPLEEALAE